MFAEFALIAPLLVILISAMFEFAGFWDARIMANHAAWTVGRIAMVRGSDLTFSTKLQSGLDKVNEKIGTKGDNAWKTDDEAGRRIKKSLGKVLDNVSVLNDRGLIATMCLMATCQMGYFGGPPGKAMNDFLREGFVDPLRQGLKKLAESAPKKISDLVSKALTSPVEKKFGGFSFIRDFISKLVEGLVKKLVSALMAPIDNLLANHMTKWINKATNKLDEFIDPSGGEGAAKRRARLFIGAARRAVQPNVVTILDPERNDWQSQLNNYPKPYPLQDDVRFRKKKNPLAYPQFCDSSIQSAKGYAIKGTPSWPPNNNAHPLYTVKIAWPYSTGWMFPILGGATDNPVSGEVRAVGTSLVFASPKIGNEHLDSTNPVEYPVGNAKDAADAALRIAAKEFDRFLRMSIYAFKYRLNRENIQIYDGIVDPIFRLIGYQALLFFTDLSFDFLNNSHNSRARKGMGYHDYYKCLLKVLMGAGPTELFAFQPSVSRVSLSGWSEFILGTTIGIKKGDLKLIDKNLDFKWWDRIMSDAEGPYGRSRKILEDRRSEVIGNVLKSQQKESVVGDWLCWPDTSPSPRYWTQTPLAFKRNVVSITLNDMATERSRDTYAQTSCYYDLSRTFPLRHLYPANAMSELVVDPNGQKEPVKLAWKLLDRKRNLRTFVWLFRPEDEAKVAKADAELLEYSQYTGKRTLAALNTLDSYIKDLESMQMTDDDDAGNDAFLPDGSEVDLTDERSVARWVMKKVDDYESEATKCLRAVNRHLPVVNKAQECVRLETRAALKARKEKFEQMDKILAEAYARLLESGETPTKEGLVEKARDVAEEQKLDYDPLYEIDALRWVHEDFNAKLDEQSLLEREYADALGSKVAKNAAGKTGDEIFENVKQQELGKDTGYGKSSNEPGSDDDYVGDRFELRNGVWEGVK